MKISLRRLKSWTALVSQQKKEKRERRREPRLVARLPFSFSHARSRWPLKERSGEERRCHRRERESVGELNRSILFTSRTLLSTRRKRQHVFIFTYCIVAPMVFIYPLILEYNTTFSLFRSPGPSCNGSQRSLYTFLHFFFLIF